MSLNPEKRKRSSKACDKCARLKIKCSSVQPCDNCAKRNIECTYLVPMKKRGPTPKAALIREAAINEEAMSLELPFEDSLPSVAELLDTHCILTHDYDHATFMNTLIPDPSGNLLSFVDFYFRYVYPRMPILSRTWILENFQLMPLYLLHIMFAICLCFPLGTKPVSLQGVSHYNYARSRTLEHLDCADPFTILSLLSSSYFSVQAGEFTTAVAETSLAIRLSQMLGFERDHCNTICWESNGVLLGGPSDDRIGCDFIRSIWLLLYINDFYAAHLFQLPLAITTEVSSGFLAVYSSANKNDASNITENYLSYAKIFIPLLALARRLVTLKTESYKTFAAVKVEISNSFTLWELMLNPAQKYHYLDEDCWIGTQSSYINCVYHASLLELQARDFISVSAKKLVSGSKLLNDEVTQICIGSIHSITGITKLLLKHNSNLDHVAIFTGYCMKVSALCLFILAGISESFAASLENAFEIYVAALETISRCTPSALKDIVLLSECKSKPHLALQNLKDLLGFKSNTLPDSEDSLLQ